MAGFCTLRVAAYPAVRAGSYRAGVAELADAHGSGPCTRKGVGVRVPSSAPSSIESLSSFPASSKALEVSRQTGFGSFRQSRSTFSCARLFQSMEKAVAPGKDVVLANLLSQAKHAPSALRRLHFQSLL